VQVAHIIKPLPVSETKHDTFENEKMHDDEMSGEEEGGE